MHEPTTYTAAEWAAALDRMREDDWEYPQERDPDELETALLEVYRAPRPGAAQHKEDPYLVAAVLAAAREQRAAWSADLTYEIGETFIGRWDSWDVIARDYADEHWPGFPPDCVKLDRMLTYAKREDELYVELPDVNGVWIFRKLEHGEP